MGPRRRGGSANGAADAASDASLVARAKRDPDAFGLLYERHRDRIVRYCFYRLGDWADAEDAANEVFAGAFVRLGRFDDRGDAFAPWLFRIAHNEVVDRYRRRASRAEVPLDAVAFYPAPGPLPDEAAADADAHDRVLALLAQLPTEDQRRVCELRLAGLTGEEIAAVLGKRHDAVRQIQGRALERLRVLLTAATVGKEASRG
jgi:RNA polymerase sigma-70 factor (ECF subfamily)